MIPGTRCNQTRLLFSSVVIDVCSMKIEKTMPNERLAYFAIFVDWLVDRLAYTCEDERFQTTAALKDLERLAIEANGIMISVIDEVCDSNIARSSCGATDTMIFI